MVEIVMCEEDMEGKQHPVMRTEGEIDSMELEDIGHGDFVDIKKKENIILATKQSEKPVTFDDLHNMETNRDLKERGEDSNKVVRKKSFFNKITKGLSTRFSNLTKSKSMKRNDSPDNKSQKSNRRGSKSS